MQLMAIWRVFEIGFGRVQNVPLACHSERSRDANDRSKDVVRGRRPAWEQRFLSVIDGGGKEIYRRRVKANLEAVNEALEPFWPRIGAMGVESAFNWYCRVDGLQAQGRDVRLGNPAEVTPTRGSRTPTTTPTRAGWRNRCGSACFRRAPSTRGRSAACAMRSAAGSCSSVGGFRRC